MKRNFTSLKIVDKFRWLYEKFGVNFVMMREILMMKLTLDSRRVPVIVQANQSKEPKGNQFIKSLWIYVLFGLMLIIFVFGDVYMMQMSIIFGMMGFILMTSFISDFSDVLLDVKDKTILGRMPVSSRTVNAAKWTHIIIYMIILTVAFAGIATFVMLAVQGIVFTLLFVLMTIFFLIFILVLTGLIYVFVLQFLDGEKLKNIINYIQIILSIGLIIGYQILFRAFDVVDISIEYTFAWWHYLVPPFWFAAPFEVLKHGLTDSSQIVMIALAVLVPVLALIIYLRLIPNFENNLEKLMKSSSNKAKAKVWMTLTSRVLCPDAVSKAYYQFVYQVVSASRTFKLKTYPSFGLAIVFPFLMIFIVDFQGFQALKSTYNFLSLYYQTLMIGLFVHMFKFSERHEASWVYEAIHLPSKQKMYAGALKVFWTKYLFPVFFITAVLFYFFFEHMTLIDVGIILVTMMISTLLSFLIVGRGHLPFTDSFKNMSNSGYSFKAFLMMFMVIPFVVIHYLLTKYTDMLFLAGYFLILVAIFAGMWKIVFKHQKIDNRRTVHFETKKSLY